LALTVKIAGTAFKYLSSLDRTTKARMKQKLAEIAESPLDPRLSKPLTATTKRCTRVGAYRILFEIDETVLFVAEIGPREQIYRTL
jgi:mRNA-degrading endonuclease RelE of RelBE toxin-antitoxin system